MNALVGAVSGLFISFEMCFVACLMWVLLLLCAHGLQADGFVLEVKGTHCLHHCAA